jgi:hypothetical protein
MRRPNGYVLKGNPKSVVPRTYAWFNPTLNLPKGFGELAMNITIEKNS